MLQELENSLNHFPGHMKVLHLNQFRAYRGGVESYIADVAANLQRQGHRSCLVSFTQDEPAEVMEETAVVPLAEWPASIEPTVASLESIIAHFQPDVVYLHAVYHPALIQWIAQRLPTVIYVHGPYPVCPGSAQYLRKTARVCPHTAGSICLVNAQREKCCWGRNPLRHLHLLERVRRFQAALANTQYILVGSYFMQQLMIRGGAHPEKTLRHAPILIDLASVPAVAVGEPGTILFAGRLTPEKGVQHLIRALALIKGNWRLLIAGDGPEREPSRRLAEKLGVSQHISFLGWIPIQHLNDCYRQCQFVVAPSLWPEPFGRIGPEAFVYGRPVVAYATGGIPDWLQDGETGYLVTPGDYEQLSQRMRQLLESPTHGQQMGIRAHEFAVERWHADVQVKQLLQVFEKAVAGFAAREAKIA